MTNALLVILFLLVAGDIAFDVWNFTQQQQRSNRNNDMEQRFVMKEELSKKLEILQESMAKCEKKLQNNDTELRNFYEDIEKWTNQLRNQISEQLLQLSAPAVSDSVQDSQNYQELSARVEELLARLEQLENQSEFSQKIQELHARIERLETENRNFSQKIQEFEEKNSAPVPVTPIQPTVTIEPEIITGKTVKEPAPQNEPHPSNAELVTPDERYIDFIKQHTGMLKDVLKPRYYQNFLDGLDKTLEEGDFSDPRDIMERIHQNVTKNIYECFTRVSLDKIPILEQFLQIIGYVPANVKEGDNLFDYADYFEGMFSQKCPEPELKNTIKKIDIHPYEIVYDDDEEPFRLKGQCVYYGGNVV